MSYAIQYVPDGTDEPPAMEGGVFSFVPGAGNQMRMTIELVTPDAARRMLADNYESQRRINQPAVSRLKRAMEQGEWVPEVAGPILVSKGGKLLDGQHRLSAVVSFGRPVHMYVCRGIDERDFPKIDSGRSRTLYQALPHGTKDRAIVTSLLRYVNGYRIHGLTYKMVDETQAAYEAVAEFERHRADYADCAHEGQRIYGVYSGGSKAGMAFVLWLVRGHPRRDDFIRGISGEDKELFWMYRTYNTWVQRNSSRAGRGAARASGGAYAYRCICALILLWNAMVDGREVRKLQASRSSLRIAVRGVTDGKPPVADVDR